MLLAHPSILKGIATQTPNAIIYEENKKKRFSLSSILFFLLRGNYQLSIVHYTAHFILVRYTHVGQYAYLIRVLLYLIYLQSAVNY